MRAITVKPGQANSVRLDDVPEPEVPDGHALIDAVALGVCGTDIEIIAGEYGWAPEGEDRLILGHESLGRVARAPKGSDLQEGDLVVGVVRQPDPVPCPACAGGEWDMCRNGLYTEHGIKQVNGFGAERWPLDPAFAVKIDPALGLLGVLLEPTSVVAKAWDHTLRIGARSRTWAPRTVLVTGAGPVGLLAAMIGRQHGLEVHVLDRVTSGPKPQLVADLGATYHAEGPELIGKLKPDVILECTGADSLVMAAIVAGGSDSIVCLAGVSSGGRKVEFDVGGFNRSAVLGNDVVFGSVNANKTHYQAAAEALARADKAWLSRLISRRVPLDRWREAFTRQDEDVKVIVQFELQSRLMSARIEDYALIGDCETAALVAIDGSIDWLCWPRFDSDACFAALLGDESHGRWKIAPADKEARISRRYLPDTLVLETTFETPKGVVQMLDFMPPRGKASDIVRLVTGRVGEVEMQMELVLRFGYGATVPWVTRLHGEVLRAIAGPDMVVLRTGAEMRGEAMTTVAEFTVREGETMPFVLTYGLSHEPLPEEIDPAEALEDTKRFWTEWTGSVKVDEPYAEAIKRSLVTLKALTYAPTGGLIAAPTTSLPEQFGGPRNWDYRYCWIRDATLTLLAFINVGRLEEARAWTDWLHRAAAGDPGDMRIMYGIGGERRLLEWQADWLPGYESSQPVRIGNAAHQQFQLDVYGELMDVFHQGRKATGRANKERWPLQLAVVEHVAKVWDQPDEGIWEVRSGPRHFTYSKVMAWVVLDRAVRCVEDFGNEGPLQEWRALREKIRDDVMDKGVDKKRGVFKRAYDDENLDASLLLLAEVGFVAPEDPVFVATVGAIEHELMTPDGLVMRYDTAKVADGLPAGEGAFLPCSFWLANAYVLLGRIDDATALFERLLKLRNDVGLMAEEYDSKLGRMAGNFPQAFSHVAMVSTAMNLSHRLKPSAQRADPDGHSLAEAG